MKFSSLGTRKIMPDSEQQQGEGYFREDTRGKRATDEKKPLCTWSSQLRNGRENLSNN